MNESSEAATKAATQIRRVPIAFADALVSMFEPGPGDAERIENAIVTKMASIIEEETHCGILLRVAEAAKKHVGPTTDCCMGGEATSELCELHQALAQWEYLTKPKDSNYE